jgi:hypothetical protein
MQAKKSKLQVWLCKDVVIVVAIRSLLKSKLHTVTIRATGKMLKPVNSGLQGLKDTIMNPTVNSKSDLLNQYLPATLRSL